MSEGSKNRYWSSRHHKSNRYRHCCRRSATALFAHIRGKPPPMFALFNSTSVSCYGDGDCGRRIRPSTRRRGRWSGPPYSPEGVAVIPDGCQSSRQKISRTPSPTGAILDSHKLSTQLAQDVPYTICTESVIKMLAPPIYLKLYSVRSTHISTQYRLCLSGASLADHAA